MYKDLLNQISRISTEFAELVDKRIRKANESNEIDQEEFQNISDGIRILHHCVMMLERIDRLHAGGDADGQVDL